MIVTVFKNIRETSTPFFRPAADMLRRIRDGANSEQVAAIRKEKDKAKRNALKATLPSICWSGKFPQRNDAAIVEHSGLVCLDFDGLKPKGLQALRERLVADPYTFALFTSPSGDGLKVLVKIPADQQDHKAHFDALADYYSEASFDTTSGNISRVCYASHDPDLFHNEGSLLWDKKKEKDWHDMSDRIPEIRLRSENEIIRRLMKWWQGKYGLVEGERNANVFKLAAAFNDFGVGIIEARSVLMEMQHDGFEDREIERIIQSAYSKREAHGTKYFEDRATRDHIIRSLIQGETKASIKATLADRMPEKEAEAAISAVERNSPWVEFWVKSDKGTVKIVNHKYKAWLEHNGFRKLYPEGSENFVFVKVEDNLISNTTSDAIKDYTLQHLHTKVADIAIFEHMAGATRYFKDDYLSMLDPIQATFVEDTAEDGMLYYQNCAVRVTKTGIETIDYLDLDGYVWRKHIVEREWYGGNDSKGDWARFVRLIAGDDDAREKSLRSTIGYMLHSHKTSAKNRAVILNDETISENPNGGSGKGLFCQGIGQMKRLVSLDGKAFKADGEFAYQTVPADTQVLVFDDVDKYFRFEKLFSIITEGITLNYKFERAIKLPVKKSPKIIITTNYTVGGVGGSFERRKWEVELSSFFSARHTPLDEFGRMLFDDWDSIEWARFDRYMVECLQMFLRDGLVASEFHNLNTRKLIKETSHEFWEWAKEGHLGPNVRHLRAPKYDEFVGEYSDYAPRGKYALTKKRWAAWLKVWAEHHGWAVEEGKDQMGQRWTMFKGDGHTLKDEAEEQPW